MRMFSGSDDDKDDYNGIKMFSDCSGPCETCKTHFTGGCLAGHDDEYCYASPEWIKKFNDDKKLKNI